MHMTKTDDKAKRDIHFRDSYVEHSCLWNYIWPDVLCLKYVN